MHPEVVLINPIRKKPVFKSSLTSEDSDQPVYQYKRSDQYFLYRGPKIPIILLLTEKSSEQTEAQAGFSLCCHRPYQTGFIVMSHGSYQSILIDQNLAQKLRLS